VDVIWITAAVLGLLLLVLAVRHRARGDAPTGRPARTAVERWWDTQEHSDVYDEEDRAGRLGPHERPRDRTASRASGPSATG
jgi:hypothetical protein